MSQYIDSKSKYEENSSTASAFLLVGSVLLVFAILCQFSIVPIRINFSTQPVMMSGFFALGIVFILIGIYSMQRAKSFKGKIETEQSQSEAFDAWFLEHYNGEQVDEFARRTTDDFDGTAQEEKILIRYAVIADLIRAQYPETSEDHLDYLTEKMYDRLFDEK